MSEDEDDYPVPSYSFTIIPNLKPEIVKVLISSSILTSCYGLSLFPESTKIGHISCKILQASIKTSLQVASLYYSNGILFINTNEKLRSELAIHFIEHLFSSNWINEDIIVLDSINESEFVGNLENRVQYIHINDRLSTNLYPLNPGNSLKGISAAVIMGCEAHKIKGTCVVGVTYSYELCPENILLYSQLNDVFRLESNISNAISRIEQEKYKHQIYS